MRRNNTFISSLLAVIFFFMVFGIGMGISKCTFDAKEETPFSQNIKAGEPVYADITYIVPQYTVSANQRKYPSGVVCNCITADESEVWVYMEVWKYEKYFDEEANLSGYLWEISYSELNYSPAIRIHGITKEAEDVCNGISKQIGCDMVILFQSVDEITK